MTVKRRDSHSTEFGLWLREQPEIDSKLGFRTYNIDYAWAIINTDSTHKVTHLMLVEEKRYRAKTRPHQRLVFKWLDDRLKDDADYYGFHTLVFEKTNPDDGQMWLNNNLISRKELISFLRFERDKNKEPQERKWYRQMLKYAEKLEASDKTPTCIRQLAMHITAKASKMEWE